MKISCSLPYGVMHQNIERERENFIDKGSHDRLISHTHVQKLKENKINCKAVIT